MKQWFRRAICALSVCVMIPALSAQDIKFGKVAEEDIRQTVYEQDKEAGAVMLHNEGHVTLEVLNGDILATYTIHRRIKILSESGFGWAEISLTYVKGGNSYAISNLKGNTHYIDDAGAVAIAKLDKKTVFDEDVSNRIGKKTFTMPQVKVGAVIEYEYVIQTSNWIGLKDFYFQHSIPCKYSKFVARLPTDQFDYLVLARGYFPIAEHLTEPFTSATNTGGGVITLSGTQHTYIAKDVPALKDEPYITTREDIILKIGHQLRYVKIGNMTRQDYMTDWANLNKTLLESEVFGMRFQGSAPKNILKEEFPLLEAEKDTVKRISMIYSLVQKRVKWNRSFDHYASPIADIWKAHEGTSGDINLLLTSLLKEAGIQASPVITSTRENGSIQKFYPFMDQFDHVICEAVAGKDTFLLDATDPYASIQMLPQYDLNYTGFRVSKENSGFITILPRHKHEDKIYARFTINPDQTLTGSISHTLSGYASAAVRTDLEEYADKHKEYFEEKIVDDFSDKELISHEVQNLDSLHKPLVLKCEVTTSDYVSSAGEFIYIKPLLNEAREKNPFSQETREYPVDFAYPTLERFTLILALPEGYTVEELPKSAAFSMPGGIAKFNLQAAEVAGNVQLVSTVELKQVSFYPEEYPALKQFFDMVVAKQAEQIVLKKVN